MVAQDQSWSKTVSTFRLLLKVSISKACAIDPTAIFGNLTLSIVSNQKPRKGCWTLAWSLTFLVPLQQNLWPDLRYSKHAEVLPSLPDRTAPREPVQHEKHLWLPTPMSTQCLRITRLGQLLRTCAFISGKTTHHIKAPQHTSCSRNNAFSWPLDQ